MGSDGMEVYDVSLFVGLHASKVKIGLKLRFKTCEISSKTAIIMTHYPYFPYRGEPLGGAMSNKTLGGRVKITIAPRNGGDDEGWTDVISLDMVGAYLKGVFKENYSGTGPEYVVVGVEPTLLPVGAVGGVWS